MRRSVMSVMQKMYEDMNQKLYDLQRQSRKQCLIAVSKMFRSVRKQDTLITRFQVLAEYKFGVKPAYRDIVAAHPQRNGMRGDRASIVVKFVDHKDDSAFKKLVAPDRYGKGVLDKSIDLDVSMMKSENDASIFNAFLWWKGRGRFMRDFAEGRGLNPDKIMPKSRYVLHVTDEPTKGCSSIQRYRPSGDEKYWDTVSTNKRVKEIMGAVQFDRYLMDGDKKGEDNELVVLIAEAEMARDAEAAANQGRESTNASAPGASATATSSSPSTTPTPMEVTTEEPPPPSRPLPTFAPVGPPPPRPTGQAPPSAADIFLAELAKEFGFGSDRSKAMDEIKKRCLSKEGEPRLEGLQDPKVLRSLDILEEEQRKEEEEKKKQREEKNKKKDTKSGGKPEGKEKAKVKNNDIYTEEEKKLLDME